MWLVPALQAAELRVRLCHLSLLLLPLPSSWLPSLTICNVISQKKHLFMKTHLDKPDGGCGGGGLGCSLERCCHRERQNFSQSSLQLPQTPAVHCSPSPALLPSWPWLYHGAENQEPFCLGWEVEGQRHLGVISQAWLLLGLTVPSPECLNWCD